MKYLLIALLSTTLISPVYAGAGHDHGESAFAGNAGPAKHFDLTDQQMTNLGIQSAPAKFLAMQETVDMLAFTELLPERKASVSPHFEGKILAVNVKVGEKVKKGQPLVKLQPVNVGTQQVVLKASIDGFVLSLSAGLGEIVQTGDDIMQIGDPSQMLVRGVAYETPNIQAMNVGQKAEIHLDITPDRHIDGKIQRINRVIDQENRTFSVYALIDTPDGDVKPGLQGTMEVFTGENAPVLSIPKRAVLGELGSYFVYVIKGNGVERRDVTLGVKSSHHVQVIDGIFPNEDVVTRGNYQLQYMSVGGIQEHDHDEGGHDEQEGHAHDDGHAHEDAVKPKSHDEREGHSHDDGHDHQESPESNNNKPEDSSESHGHKH